MVTATKRADEPRWQLTLREPHSLDEDLGSTGQWVGPRTGPAKRNHGEKEDYVLRRLLLAFADAGTIPYPVTIRAEMERNGEPDFVLDFGNGKTLGLEITEAGNREYQAWLTRSERLAPGDAAFVMDDEEGIVDRIEIGNVAGEIANAIRDKNAAKASGKYTRPSACDLVVYDNTAWGGFLDKSQIVARLRQMNDLSAEFHAVHVVFESHVAIDVFGSGFKLISIRDKYGADLASWADAQAARLRQGKFEQIDARNVAEEIESLGKSDRRALKSHLRNLLLHLLKWQFQPERRGASWRSSIAEAREEIEALIAESPSLSSELHRSLARVYDGARRAASAETGLPRSSFPETCPFRLEDVVDDAFLPESKDNPN